MTEALINRARLLLVYLSPGAAMVYLYEHGTSREESFLAVAAARILEGK